ncbi:MAG: helix-turn-helix transcriptional regulator [Flavobacteriaceae bacterium]|nr:helix-turn-helix transcriptional regulator [Flavobacteriaceae bacterium]
MTRNEEILLTETREHLLISIGKRVQELREQKGLSQVDLAGKIIGKFDTTNISRIESGRTNPTIFTLQRIAIALEISLKELVAIDEKGY